MEQLVVSAKQGVTIPTIQHEEDEAWYCHSTVKSPCMDVEVTISLKAG